MQLGIDVLQQQGFSILKGKRVGLITNQTGVNSAGVKTRVILAHAPGVKLVALFTPEHGLDGTETAGRYVSTRRDPITGLTAFSLYGPTRKPTPQMLAGIDVLVYDMQDIGCRSYTYISTLAKCMEAAGEKGIEVVVLDRPNPLGGMRVEGPAIESRWISFIGQLPVPYVHGMTAGELAKMSNALGWTRPPCRLTVIPMRGWSRQMVWEDTGLRWVKPSPNIPYDTSPLYYVATGMIGELAGMETGRGHAPGLPDRGGERRQQRPRVLSAMAATASAGGDLFALRARPVPGRAAAHRAALRCEPHGAGHLPAAGHGGGESPGSLREVRQGEAGDVLQGLRKRGDPRPNPARDAAGADRGWLGGTVSRFESARGPFLLY